ncbi:TPA: hypothetical protein ACNIAK_002256 [Enterococcus faecalis]|uniref:hypothetical protein n=1 Tax=Enterococcus faecalis TaxID=1351 RepID=UPI001E2E0C1E|nr:hypothetical protein [Enterococcus faecalis]EMC0698312.1 hypothetical protein [Enterococcus faecalis]MCD5130325.1 hypothetical protein [Enterococcus faecalis]MDV2557238.1 hypothetical protein [Enterococcus faecalis]MDY2531903.1 hypothetical protein [Enterococcus faecalis]UQQ63208.1 hypothetical protein LQ054_04790 [Enterococcus faecalis]
MEQVKEFIIDKLLLKNTNFLILLFTGFVLLFHGEVSSFMLNMDFFTKNTNSWSIIFTGINIIAFLIPLGFIFTSFLVLKNRITYFIDYINLLSENLFFIQICLLINISLSLGLFGDTGSNLLTFFSFNLGITFANQLTNYLIFIPYLCFLVFLPVAKVLFDLIIRFTPKSTEQDKILYTVAEENDSFKVIKRYDGEKIRFVLFSDNLNEEVFESEKKIEIFEYINCIKEMKIENHIEPIRSRVAFDYEQTSARDAIRNCEDITSIDQLDE